MCIRDRLNDIARQIKVIVNEVIDSELNYIVIFPNNDPGTDLIIREYERLSNIDRFRVYPSMRFEYFLSLLNSAKFIIGNSSAGVREAPHFGVPAINLGSRQSNRVISKSVINEEIIPDRVNKAILYANRINLDPTSLFGAGDSNEKFLELLNSQFFWETDTQKYFIDKA